MDKTVHISEMLTPAEFYRSLLPEVNMVQRYYDKIDNVIFDFSGTRKIEPNVLPNLLCIGRNLWEKYEKKAVLDIPDTYNGSKIKDYLYSIGFSKLARDVFEFESDIYGGVTGDVIDPLCCSVYFEQEVKPEKITSEFKRLVEPFADKYLKRYDRIRLDTGQIENMVTDLLQELAINAATHGQSYSYITMHARYSDSRIHIAISDKGDGLYKSCCEKHWEDITERGIRFLNDFDAIMYCVYMRSPSQIFGLYAIVREVLEVGGLIRIHSKDTQAVFTGRLLRKFEDRTLVHDSSFLNYNVRKNLSFKGVHVEIEIPF